MGSPAGPRPLFSIERILGLDLNRFCMGTSSNTTFHLYRPWTEPSESHVTEPQSSTELPSNQDQTFCCKQQQQQNPFPESARPILNWYIGRRPRTAFTSAQVEVLERVFQINSYPGIQLREELAHSLHLEEDRIQIWFQNRRAKLKRSHRECRLQLVQTALAHLSANPMVKGQLMVKQEVMSDLRVKQEVMSDPRVKVDAWDFKVKEVTMDLKMKESKH